MKPRIHRTVPEYLAGRKILFHGTHKDELKESILREGILHKYANDPNSKSRIHLMDKASQAYNPKIKSEDLNDLVYTVNKKNYDFSHMMTGVEDPRTLIDMNKASHGRVLRISLPNEFYKKLPKVTDPEYKEFLDNNNKEYYSKRFYNTDYSKLPLNIRISILDFIADIEKIRKGNETFKGVDIPSKYIQGSKDYQPVTSREIISNIGGKMGLRKFSYDRGTRSFSIQ